MEGPLPIIVELPEALLLAFARHSLTVQSTLVVRNRSEKSTGPCEGWKFRLVTGPMWPL